MSTGRKSFGTHPYINLVRPDRPWSANPEEMRLKNYDRATLSKTPLRVFLPYERIGRHPNLLKNFEQDLQRDFKSMEEDLMIAQGKVQDLKNTIERVDSPSEGLLNRKKAAELALEEMKTIIAERLTQRFEILLRWLVQEWPQIKLTPYKLSFDLSVAVSALFDNLDHLENRFGLKDNPVRKNLVESLSKDCDEEAVLIVVAQESQITHSREEMDKITEGIPLLDDEQIPSSKNYSPRKTIPGIPVQAAGPSKTMRPTFEPMDEAERKYRESLALQKATSERWGKPMAPWSPANAKREEEAQRAAEAGVNKLTAELAGKLIPKAAPLPSFDGLPTAIPETTEQPAVVPEPPKTKPAIPRPLSTVPGPKMAPVVELTFDVPEANPLLGTTQSTSQTYRTAVAARNSDTSSTPAPRNPESIEPPAVKTEQPYRTAAPKVQKQEPVAKPPVKKSIWGRVAASVSIVAMAGLAAFGLNKSKAPAEDSPNTVQSTVATASAAPSSAPSTLVIEEAPKPVPTIKVQPPVVKVESKPAARTFAKVLTESKSPIVQDILNKGETKLLIKNGTIVGMFIDSFQGLTNDRQKVEMKELEDMINQGLGVYFNEHFGSPAKVEAILKGNDQRMKNLYRTAKYAQEKGWTNSGLTKEKFPEAYAFAEMILKDASDLRMDESDNPDPKVQAFVTGNMFQAKMIGSNLKTRKANGEDHVILECIYKIFEGGNAHDALKEVQAARLAKAAEVVNPAPAKQPGQQLNQSPVNGQTGTILPNILVNPNQLDRQTGDLKLMEEVDAGWDEIADQQEALEFERQLFEKSDTVDFLLPMDLTKSERNKLIVPKVADELARLYPQVDEQKLRSMIKQWGYIGFAGVKDNGDKVEVKLHRNFVKILRMILDKKVVARNS